MTRSSDQRSFISHSPISFPPAASSREPEFRSELPPEYYHVALPVTAPQLHALSNQPQEVSLGDYLENSGNVLQYSKGYEGNGPGVCQICLQDVPTNSTSSPHFRVLSCNHCVHDSCLVQWIESQRLACPTCARPIMIQDSAGYML